MLQHWPVFIAYLYSKDKIIFSKSDNATISIIFLTLYYASLIIILPISDGWSHNIHSSLCWVSYSCSFPAFSLHLFPYLTLLRFLTLSGYSVSFTMPKPSKKPCPCLALLSYSSNRNFQIEIHHSSLLIFANQNSHFLGVLQLGTRKAMISFSYNPSTSVCFLTKKHLFSPEKWSNLNRRTSK